MPLLDHFHPPLDRTHPWRSFHGSWAAAMARLLNAGVLPEGYYAIPFLDSDGPVEIDVAALGARSDPIRSAPSSWTPGPPPLAVVIDPPAPDGTRVNILSNNGDPRLTAAIELVSPANKDRPATREQFVAKCTGLLGRVSGLVVVDLVATLRADLHAAFLTALGAATVTGGPPVPSAIAYRTSKQGDHTELLAWPMALAVGRPLPTLPLWLAPDLCVPLDLEASYSAACTDLRIRHAG